MELFNKKKAPHNETPFLLKNTEAIYCQQPEYEPERG